MTIESEYIKAAGEGCPFCKSTNIDGEGVQIEPGIAIQEVGCNECYAEWEDHYKIDHIRVTVEPKHFDSEVQGRAPTHAERASIRRIFEGYEPGIINVHDNYISDCPGYAGWLAVTVSGEPQFCATFTKDSEGNIELCAQATDTETPCQEASNEQTNP